MGNKKIKIAYILLHLGNGGTEAFVANVINELDKSKYDISVILASNEEKGFLEEKIVLAGAKVYKTIYVNGIINRIKHLKMVEKILLETGPYDVVHGNIDLFNGVELRIAKKLNIPIRICHSHNSKSQNANTIIRKIAFTMYKKVMMKLIMNNANVLLGCSDLAMEYLYGDGWDRSNSKIIFNGIPLDKFRNPNINISEYSKKNNIDINKINFVTVGRFVQQKNPLFLVDIIYELSLIRNDIIFNWIGNGELEKEVKNKVKELNIEDKFNFLGVRKDIPELLNCFDYFLLPSLFEGLPFVLMEAQAANLTCFMSDTISDMSNCGKCMQLPLNENAKFWAEEINNYINSGNDLIINEEKLNNFNIKNTVKQLEEFYNRKI